MSSPPLYKLYLSKKSDFKCGLYNNGNVGCNLILSGRYLRLLPKMGKVDDIFIDETSKSICGIKNNGNYSNTTLCVEIGDHFTNAVTNKAPKIWTTKQEIPNIIFQ
eukprot:NODE_89_length_21781_cov_0.895836.p25 type:complete len:106 gc:universal NODE_89_length_21781_cov_0.895836:14982-14665(-)